MLPSVGCASPTVLPWDSTAVTSDTRNTKSNECYFEVDDIGDAGYKGTDFTGELAEASEMSLETCELGSQSAALALED